MKGFLGRQTPRTKSPIDRSRGCLSCKGVRIGSPLGEPISGGESASDEELNGAIFPPAPSLEEQLWLDPSFRTDGMIVIDHGVFRAAMQQPLAPLQPLQPVQPPSIAPYQPSIPNTFDTLATTSIAELAAAVGGGPAQGRRTAASTGHRPDRFGRVIAIVELGAKREHHAAFAGGLGSHGPRLPFRADLFAGQRGILVSRARRLGLDA